jgi:hypothetical protein
LRPSGLLPSGLLPSGLLPVGLASFASCEPVALPAVGVGQPDCSEEGALADVRRADTRSRYI